MYNRLIETLLEEDAYYSARATGLVSATQAKEKHREEIKNILTNSELRHAIERGFSLIRSDIIEVLKEDELGVFFNELAKINRQTLISPPENVKKKIEAGGVVTLQEWFDLSNDALKKMYKLGYQFFQKEANDEAIAIFLLITTLNPFISDFWNALALCYQAKNEWDLAIDTFAIACTTNEHAVSPRVSKAECCISLQKIKDAKEELEVVDKMIEENPGLDAKWGAYLQQLKSSC